MYIFWEEKRKKTNKLQACFVVAHSSYLYMYIIVGNLNYIYMYNIYFPIATMKAAHNLKRIYIHKK